MSETITEEEEYWEEYGWVPTTVSGKQRSPHSIRLEFQKYIDESTETQTSILKRIGVNSNSFRKFMNPSTYKDAWRAVQNGTYLAAARLLEEERYRKKKFGGKKKKTVGNAKNNDSDNGNKRKASPAGDPQKSDTKKPRAGSKSDAEQLLFNVTSTQCDATPEVIYDSCPQLVKKVKEFLKRDGITKTSLCNALGVQSVQLNKFLLSKNQDSCATVIYPKLWMFFERLRIYEKQDKSSARIKNEEDHPGGFSLIKVRRNVKYLFAVNF